MITVRRIFSIVWSRKAEAGKQAGSKRSEELEMDEKNYTEVLINGNVYTLGGAEDPEYLQKVAAYINEKVAVLKAQPGFTRQNKDYQEVMIYLNLADDYFKTLQEAMMLRAQKDEMEKEIYSLKARADQPSDEAGGCPERGPAGEKYGCPRKVIKDLQLLDAAGRRS